jgi:dCMP deaminase
VTRPTRDETLMEVAWAFSRRSTCSRLHVGAVFARDGRILATGYNGAPAKLPHCSHGEDLLEEAMDEALGETKLGVERGCTDAEHAERNGIAYAARYGLALEGCELFVTHMPCLPCAMSIVNAGVKRVTFQEAYRIVHGINLFHRAGLQVSQFKPK